MSARKNVPVRGHKRAGKWIKSHVRGAKKKISQSNPANRGRMNVDTDNGGVHLSVDDDVYKQLQNGVDKPIETLKKGGLTATQIKQLIQERGFDEKGHITVKNRSTGDMSRVKVFDFLNPPSIYKPSDVEPMSREIID